VREHENGLTTTNYTELKMAINIIAELDKANMAVRAIRAFAECSDEDFPDMKPPNWAIVLEVLANLAEQELENLHDRLTLLLNGPPEARTNAQEAK